MEIDYGILKYVIYVGFVLLGFIVAQIIESIYWKGYRDGCNFIYSNYSVFEKRGIKKCGSQK